MLKLSTKVSSSRPSASLLISYCCCLFGKSPSVLQVVVKIKVFLLISDMPVFSDSASKVDSPEKAIQITIEEPDKKKGYLKNISSHKDLEDCDFII